jgi:hypothetical protein
MKTRILVGLSLLVSLAAPSHGQNSAFTRSTMAGLRGVMIDVVHLAPEIEDKGMTPFVIAVEVERRLKESGVPVYTSGAPELAPGLPTLYVEVNAVLHEYSERCTWAVRVDLMQAARLERSMDSQAVMASTWSVGGVGYVTTDWRRAILDDVIVYTDRFVEAFAAANPDGIEP